MSQVEAVTGTMTETGLSGEMSNYNETYVVFTNITSIKNNTDKKRSFHQFDLSPGKPRNCQPGWGAFARAQP